MKKKVLTVFPFLHHRQLVEGLCKALKANGLEADALYWDSVSMKFFSISGLKKSLSYLFFSILFQIFRRVPGAWRLGIAGHYKNKCYYYLIQNYDVIILAGVYDEDRMALAKIAKKKGRKVIVSLWGGDLYFIQDYVNDWRNLLFSMSDIIICGGLTMKNDFVKAFPQYANKAEPLSYGLSQFDLLKDLSDSVIKGDLSFLDEGAKEKIVITIGYSGRPWQQHFYVLDAIDRLPQSIKVKLFLLLPMTYDSEGHYLSYIKYRLDEIGISYQILRERLSLVQNLSMRLVSDISIVIQKADAMSASVQEHLMAGSVLIAGDWLPYDELTENGVYFQTTSFDKLYEKIQYVISNLDEEKVKCSKNTDIMYTLRSWDSVGPQFAKHIQNLFA